MLRLKDILSVLEGKMYIFDIDTSKPYVKTDAYGEMPDEILDKYVWSVCGVEEAVMLVNVSEKEKEIKK